MTPQIEERMEKNQKVSDCFCYFAPHSCGEKYRNIRVIFKSNSFIEKSCKFDIIEQI